MSQTLTTLLMVSYMNITLLLRPVSLIPLFQSLALIENGSVAVSRIHEVATLPEEPDRAQLSATPSVNMEQTYCMRYCTDVAAAQCWSYWYWSTGTQSQICTPDSGAKSGTDVFL